MDKMEESYLNPRQAGSYSGLDKAYRSQQGLSRGEVRKWLSKQDAYTLHKPVRYNFKRNRIITSHIDGMWECDLAVMPHKEENDNHQFILVCTDVLSHYAWTRALKSKKSSEMVEAFSSIFQEGRTPTSLRTDRGGEFNNNLVKKLFEKHRIHYYLTNNELKASIVERLIRTLKNKMSRYFTYHETRRWVEVLPELTESYNQTFHRSIQRTPASVTPSNQAEAWQTQYLSEPSPLKGDKDFALEVGDTVRISLMRRAFQKESEERWTGELFKIEGRRVRGGLNIYTLVDFTGEEVEGTFYESELQKVVENEKYKIEKIVRSRRRKGQEKEYLVKWKYWPAKFNSWVKSSEVGDLEH